MAHHYLPQRREAAAIDYITGGPPASRCNNGSFGKELTFVVVDLSERSGRNLPQSGIDVPFVCCKQFSVASVDVG